MNTDKRNGEWKMEDGKFDKEKLIKSLIETSNEDYDTMKVCGTQRNLIGHFLLGI